MVHAHAAYAQSAAHTLPQTSDMQDLLSHLCTCRMPSKRSRWPPEKPRQLARMIKGRPSLSNSSIACAVFCALLGYHTCSRPKAQGT